MTEIINHWKWNAGVIDYRRASRLQLFGRFGLQFFVATLFGIFPVVGPVIALAGMVWSVVCVVRGVRKRRGSRPVELERPSYADDLDPQDVVWGHRDMALTGTVGGWADDQGVRIVQPAAPAPRHAAWLPDQPETTWHGLDIYDDELI